MSEEKKADRQKVSETFERAIADMVIGQVIEDDEEDSEVIGDTEQNRKWGTEEFDNPFDEYAFGLAGKILDEYEVSDDEAFGYIMIVAEMLAEKGILPAFPEEEAEMSEFVKWVGAAKTCGFENLLMKFLEAESETQAA